MTRQLERAMRPDKFIFRIGGFHGPNHRLELHGDSLIYFSDAATEELNPSPAKWRNFIARLDDQRVWQWKKTYSHPHVLDGTQWELEVAIGDKKVKSGGSNRYPGNASDPECMDFSESSPQFDAFLAALKNLTGRKIR